MNYDKLLELINKDEIEQIIENMNRSSEEDYLEITKYFLDILETVKDNNIRNSVAYLLGEIKCHSACDILVKLIFNAELKNNRGTLLSALGKLDCVRYINQLLPLLYEGNFEVVMNTYTLLQENVPKMPKDDKWVSSSFLKNKISEFEEILDTLYDVYENIFDEVLEED